VVIILNFAYFFGFFYFVYCDVEYEILSEDKSFDLHNTFAGFYDILDRTPANRAVLLVYYSFTTLATVGYGDFTPKSDNEKIVITIIFVFGVGLFSYIMGNFINYLSLYKTLNAEIDEGD
jgi:hypothetical protein